MVPRTALHLCSGYGGFELALAPLGVRTVGHVERDAYAAAVLVARMEEARLDQAPIWSDLETFNGARWRGRVDLVTAGFPCQPFSSAGEQRGTDDERWLWPDIARIVADVGPRFVFLENVPGLVRHGLPHVCADLAELGFDAEWGLYRASAVGAPHRRERFWLLAGMDYAEDDRLQTGQPERASAEHTEAGHSGEDVAHAESVGGDAGNRSTPAGTRGRRLAETDREGLADSDDSRRGPVGRQDGIVRRDADRCGSSWPPAPGDIAGWERWITEGGPEPAIRRSTDGPPLGLADALHLGGNGLVPQAARAAFVQLYERLMS